MEKLCTKCGIVKDINEFSFDKKQNRALSYCKECSRELVRQRRAKAPDKNKKAYQMKWRYDLTPEQFNQMIDEQGNRCAICLDEFSLDRLPEVDHDHKTGKIRGVLCNRCNVTLGMCQDDPEYLRKKGHDEAAWYVEAFERRQ